MLVFLPLVFLDSTESPGPRAGPWDLVSEGVSSPGGVIGESRAQNSPGRNQGGFLTLTTAGNSFCSSLSLMLQTGDFSSPIPNTGILPSSVCLLSPRETAGLPTQAKAFNCQCPFLGQPAPAYPWGEQKLLQSNAFFSLPGHIECGMEDFQNVRCCYKQQLRQSTPPQFGPNNCIYSVT